mmetsp:Transcript_52657/g.60239  ORF Transcript_52657/g.60239 Transcript_52657/m.60239 type:complete len:276 (-) Transcript_52657:235-1062(-)
MAEKLFNRMIGLGSTMLFFGAFGNQMMFTVDGGERAVVYNKFSGVKKTIYGEGLHFMLPVVEKPTIFQVRLRPTVINSHTGTKDLQTVNISLRLLFRPNEEYLVHILKTLGEHYENVVLPSIGNEVLKAIVAQYNAEQLLTQRDKVSADIREGLTARAREFNIFLDDVSITHLNFGREFARAIEEKQVAQQEAERSKFIVMRNEEEKRAEIIRAEGTAEAATLISKAFTEGGDGIIEFRRIQAAEHIAKQLADKQGVTYIPGGNGNLLNIPISPQ